LAKFQTLGIVERLRRENIPVYHSLTKENITGQMAAAEYLKVSHLLIVGQKEAIEHSVVVRSTDVREQETVRVDELALYLKKIMRK
jgi:histidyl-tRNA synthetase